VGATKTPLIKGAEHGGVGRKNEVEKRKKVVGPEAIKHEVLQPRRITP